MTLDQIKVVNLSEDELYTIHLYTALYFPKGLISKRDTQWHYEKETRNPNWTGIVGEWGLLKSVGYKSLYNFLINRPYMRSDIGDIENDFGLVLDIKTNVWRAPPKALLNKSYFCGNVEAKHIKKDFLDGFIFAVFVPEERSVNIMGYLLRDSFFPELGGTAKFRAKGTEKENGFVFPTDAYDITYKSLRPPSELGTIKSIIQ